MIFSYGYFGLQLRSSIKFKQARNIFQSHKLFFSSFVYWLIGGGLTCMWVQIACQ